MTQLWIRLDAGDENLMDTDELRGSIWDYLFESRSTKSIDEIAALADCDAVAVRTAVDHEWFTIAQDRVSIAYAAPGLRTSR
jgi:hypothetical protein